MTFRHFGTDKKTTRPSNNIKMKFIKTKGTPKDNDNDEMFFEIERETKKSRILRDAGIRFTYPLLKRLSGERIF